MVRERWWVDGYELTDGLVRDVSTRDGLYRATSAASRNASDQFVAGRHGALDSGQRKYGPGTTVLQMWLGDTSRAAVEQAIDDLYRVLAPVHRNPTYVRQLADGSQRTAKARLAQDIEPAALGQLAANLQVELEVPGVFWRDVNVTSDATVAGAALPQTLALTSKGRASAPFVDGRFIIDGPVAQPTVKVTSDPEVQDSFTYSDIIPAGTSLVIDTASWQASWAGLGGVGNPGGGLPDPMGLLSWTGDYILEVPPAPFGTPAPVLLFTGSSGGATTRLTVTGQTPFLC